MSHTYKNENHKQKRLKNQSVSQSKQFKVHHHVQSNYNENEFYHFTAFWDGSLKMWVGLLVVDLIGIKKTVTMITFIRNDRNELIYESKGFRFHFTQFCRCTMYIIFFHRTLSSFSYSAICCHMPSSQNIIQIGLACYIFDYF